MLSRILLAKPLKGQDPSRSGISCSALFPCPYRLYLIHTGKMPPAATDARTEYNLADGWDQEEQSVKRLEAVGVYIKDRGMTVSVGKTHIQGHIDGIFSSRGKKKLWEHKAMDGYRFYLFSTYGLEYFLNYECQTQSYLLGTGLEEGEVLAKNKETNDYKDLPIILRKDFILPIIEWADKVRSGWVPEPKECPGCNQCGINCFGPTLDFSKIANMSDPELALEWRNSTQLYKVGDYTRERVRARFEQLLGDKETLMLEGLKIDRIPVRKAEIDESKVLSFFGPDALMEVTKWNRYYQIRVTDTLKKKEEQDGLG